MLTLPKSVLTIIIKQSVCQQMGVNTVNVVQSIKTQEKLGTRRLLSLTPQLRQSLAVLSMTPDELYEYLLQLAEKNPIISFEAIAGAQRRRYAGCCDRWGEARDLDTYPAPGAEDERGDIRLEVKMSALPEPMKRTVCGLLTELDDNGYLPGDTAAFLRSRGASEAQAREAIELLRSFCPPGAGAFSLEECLRLQIDGGDKVRRDAVRLLTGDLGKLAKGGLSAAAGAASLSVGEAAEAFSYIKTLDPKPMRSAPAGAVSYAVPDIVIRKGQDGFRVELNQITGSDIAFEPSVMALCDETEDGAAEYIAQKLSEARHLRRCVSEREKTLLNCTRRLIEAQRGFFCAGPSFIRPFSRKDLAATLGISGSTVCRVFKDAVIDTDFGVYPAAYFFPQPLGAEGDAVREDALTAIRLLVSQEEASAPLSDRELAQSLSERGVRLSRRGVAKYRERLGIPPSYLRRSDVYQESDRNSRQNKKERAAYEQDT